MGVGSLRFPADRLSVFGRCGLAVAFRPEHLGELEMGLGVVWAEREGLAATGHGLVQLAGLGVDDGQIEIGLGVLGIEPQGLAVRGDRLGEPAKLAADGAQVVVGLGQPGRQPHGLLQGGQGLVEAAQHREQVA